MIVLKTTATLISLLHPYLTDNLIHYVQLKLKTILEKIKIQYSKNIFLYICNIDLHKKETDTITQNHNSQHNMKKNYTFWIMSIFTHRLKRNGSNH